jgi:hypothetical protein
VPDHSQAFSSDDSGLLVLGQDLIGQMVQGGEIFLFRLTLAITGITTFRFVAANRSTIFPPSRREPMIDAT